MEVIEKRSRWTAPGNGQFSPNPIFNFKCTNRNENVLNSNNKVDITNLPDVYEKVKVENINFGPKVNHGFESV